MRHYWLFYSASYTLITVKTFILLFFTLVIIFFSFQDSIFTLFLLLFYFLTIYQDRGYSVKMDYPNYIALFNYITRKTYPLDSTQSIKSMLRKKSKRYLAQRGKIYQKVLVEGKEYIGRELLHEGTIEAAVLKVHSEGHLGINNTWKKVQLQYVGKNLYEKDSSYLNV